MFRWILTKNPGRQEQVGTPLMTSHLVFTPQGLGVHNSARKKQVFDYFYNLMILLKLLIRLYLIGMAPSVVYLPKQNNFKFYAKKKSSRLATIV